MKNCYKVSFFILMFLIFSLTFTSVFPQTDGKALTIEEKAYHALVTLPYYTVFDIFRIEVEGSTVILSGEVTRPLLKTDAEKTVKRISGVQDVKNEIEVLPISPNDDRIRMGVYQAIYYHPEFNRYALRAFPPIHIIVKNGDVKLEGKVANEGDKNLVGIRAKGVAGVFSVTNNLVF